MGVFTRKMRFLGWFSWAVVLTAASAESPPPPLPATDPDIRQLVADISAERIQRSIYVLASYKTRNTLSDPASSADGVGAAAAWIRTQFEKIAAETGGRMTVEADTFLQPPLSPGIPQPVEITNVVATLPGTRPESAGRVYVVCAHYDSCAGNVLDADSPAPGADDDASGVAALIESARILAHHDFPATIVFLAVAGAEQGQWGSRHWAKAARDRGVDIEGVFNDDIIGSSHGPDGTVDRGSVRLFAAGLTATDRLDAATAALIRSGGENDTPPRQLARTVRDAARVYVPGISVRIVGRADRYGRAGDQLPFLEQGFAAVRFTEPAEDDRHQREDVRTVQGVAYGDTIDHVDFPYVADVARVNAAALAELARAPAAPRLALIAAESRDSGTTLQWAPNSEPDLAGYRVLWRDTQAASWEHSSDVPAGRNRVTLPVAKDDVVFGLAAFDAAGHVSPAVFPLPL